MSQSMVATTDAHVESADSEHSLWLHLSALSPQLRRHIKVHPQMYRGERWFVLHDETNGKHLRVNSQAFSLIGRMDGKQTIAAIHEHLVEAEGSVLDRKDVIDIIAQLQHFGALRDAMDRSSSALIAHYHQTSSRLFRSKLMSPLMIRIPLFDPDRLLQSMLPFTRLFFNRYAVLIWCLVVMAGISSVLANWTAINQEFDSQLFKPSNLVLLWLLYPALKTIHEFSHALCVKFWGGEVHEMGITLLVLTPVPYVDASAASSFKSKHKRMMVSAAGILVELFLAAIAILFWVNAESGFLADCAFGIFTIGSISTVLFNANPLLKFDGYFILQDWLEIPNLYARSAAYYKYLAKKYWLKVDGAVSPQTAIGERIWFLIYGATSQVYRLFVMFFIVAFLSGKFLFVGVALGVWAVIQQVFLPLYRGVTYLLKSPDLGARRMHLVSSLIAVLAVVILGLAYVPVPSTTFTQGVVWMPEQGQLFAGSAGFVGEVVVQPGAEVEAGDVLLRLSNPDLSKEVEVAEAEIAALGVQAAALAQDKLAEISMVKQDLQLKQSELESLQVSEQAQTIRAAASGTFAVASSSNLLGNYYAQGDLVGHIVDRNQLVVRVAVSEVHSGLLHKGIARAAVRLAGNLSQLVPAELERETPSANNRLPSAALGVKGGGGIAVASHDPEGLTSVEKVFHLQLTLAEETEAFGVGERAYVKLTHNSEPLAARWYRSFQQLFLKKLPA